MFVTFTSGTYAQALPPSVWGSLEGEGRFLQPRALSAVLSRPSLMAGQQLGDQAPLHSSLRLIGGF